MAGYVHVEGKGRMFKVKDRKTEKYPHFQGNAMYKGEIIQVSGWLSKDEDGRVGSIGISVQEPKQKEEEAPAKQVSKDDEWGI